MSASSDPAGASTLSLGVDAGVLGATRVLYAGDSVVYYLGQSMTSVGPDLGLVGANVARIGCSINRANRRTMV